LLRLSQLIPADFSPTEGSTDSTQLEFEW
jgi:hypothetical protein